MAKNNDNMNKKLVIIILIILNFYSIDNQTIYGI